MKSERHAKILELVRKYEFETQEDLQAKLNELGFKATQATVSRDIRELGLVKTESANGVYKYHVVSDVKTANDAEAFGGVLRQAILSVAAANNLVVVKTYAGMGSAVGAAVDLIDFEEVVGTLAGDDTLLVIARDNSAAEKVQRALNEFALSN